MKRTKPPSFLRSISLLLVGTSWTIGYSFLSLQMLREGYWITAYATLPFIALGVVIAILGVRRAQGFIKYLNEQEKFRMEQERFDEQLTRNMGVAEQLDRQDPERIERPAE